MTDGKTAIVLLNMGGAENDAQVAEFLENMFRDRRIMPIGFKPLRYAVAWLISKFRAKKSREHYRQIGYSPLLKISRSLACKLAKLAQTEVFLAMRYTAPSALETVREIEARGFSRLILLPLYPQYSTTTTLSAMENFYAAAEGLNAKIATVDRFYDRASYNACVADEIKRALAGANAADFALVLSAHGLPQKVSDGGDPYRKECEEHAALIAKFLAADGVNFAATKLSYQSKVGPVKWLEPSLEAVLEELAQSGAKRVLIAPISFAIDNLETDYELAIDYKSRAIAMGFEEVLIAKCPNDSDRFAQALCELAIDAALKMGWHRS